MDSAKRLQSRIQRLENQLVELEKKNDSEIERKFKQMIRKPLEISA